MRPDQHWIVLSWAILFLTSKADTEDCETELQVRRNTMYEVSLGQQLKIECPAVFCNNLLPTVNWYKMEEKFVLLNINNTSRIKTEWEYLNPSKGISYLIFQSIISSDNGSYHCKSGGSVSHAIYITVNAEGTNSTTKTINITNDQSGTGLTDEFWMYVYSAAGIGCFVIIVIIISVICMRGCKGKSSNEKQNVNQYMELPLAERPTGLQHSPRGSPNLLPPRRASGRKPPAEETISRDNEQLYGQRTQDRNRQRNAAQVEEPGSLVYAALNHAPLPRDAPQPQRQTEETEYAAIRLA